MTTEWVAPPVDRSEPERIAGERDALEQWLDYHRDTLLNKCAGLSGAQLKLRAVPPSPLSLLGLVRHMTEVERWWFRMHGIGAEIDFVYCNEQDSADFDEVDGADADSDLATFRAELEASRAAARTKELGDIVPSRGHHPENTRDMRWIFIHMIEEYARHNGHADLIRECIDGSVGD